MILVDSQQLLNVQMLAITLTDPMTRSMMLWLQALSTQALQQNTASPDRRSMIVINMDVYAKLAPLKASADANVRKAAEWGDVLCHAIWAYNVSLQPKPNPLWPKPPGGPAMGWWG